MSIKINVRGVQRITAGGTQCVLKGNIAVVNGRAYRVPPYTQAWARNNQIMLDDQPWDFSKAEPVSLDEVDFDYRMPPAAIDPEEKKAGVPLTGAAAAAPQSASAKGSDINVAASGPGTEAVGAVFDGSHRVVKLGSVSVSASNGARAIGVKITL